MLYFSDAILEVKDSLDKDLKFYCDGSDGNFSDALNLNTLLQQSTTMQPPEPKNRDFYGKFI